MNIIQFGKRKFLESSLQGIFVPEIPKRITQSLKPEIMFRVCLTLIAYIISFLSHSNEMQDGADKGIEHLSTQHHQTYQVPKTLALQKRKKNVNLDLTVKRNTK
jgi:hypothetical protein